MNKVIAMIPARYEATRFPGKLMKILAGKTIIRRTYEAVLQTNLFDEVVVVCDDARIAEEITAIGGKVFMSTKPHESGSDRIAEACVLYDTDIIVNVQGDEPFIEKSALQKVIQLFQNPKVTIASLKMPITDLEQIQNPNCVKVVTNKEGKALYFSRSPIPFQRDTSVQTIAYKHIGIYAFTKKALLTVTSLPPSPLECAEKLENLRMLENGIDIYLETVDHIGISIDTPEDFTQAEKLLSEK